MDLSSYLRERVVHGLKRKSLTKESVWAERYRVMKSGPWSFTRHPWLKQMHDDQNEVIIGQKAAQMGFSEWAIDKTFFWLDILGEDVLYLLPNSKPDSSDFSIGRFEPALDLSEHIGNMFSDTKNVGMKKAGKAILYIRGSRSESQLKSIPTGRIVYDEFDEMAPTVRALAQERMSGQTSRQELLISTPTIPDFGINAEFLASDQKHFFFKCPRCGKWEELTYEKDEPSSIIITAERFNDPSVNDSHLVCKNTGKRLEHESKPEWLESAIWVPQHDNTIISGYHINQLYSTAAHPSKFAIAKLRGDTNPAFAQEFAKSKLGSPYIETGSRVTDQELKEATRPYHQVHQWQGGMTFMGVDVGTRLHYEVCEYQITGQGIDINNMAKSKVLKAGFVKDFEELDHLMAAFHIIHCVIDANPERRKATEFAERHLGRVSLCYYIVGLSNANPIVIQPEILAVKVDRTSWLDLTLSRFRDGTKTIPVDVSEEYAPHMKALVRRYNIAVNGDISANYVNASTADHLAHAANYCEIALNVGTSTGTVQNI